MAKKGSAEERDLVHKLWERDFAAMRAPASGECNSETFT